MFFMYKSLGKTMLYLPRWILSFFHLYLQMYLLSYHIF